MSSLIKIALGQFEIKPGHPDLNTNRMLEMIQSAKESKADLIVFPEMAIPGYLIGDTWEQNAFLRDCEYYGKKIIAASDTIAIMFGNIAVDWTKKNTDGRVRKYNAFFTAYKKNLIQSPASPYPFIIKTLQPNYRAFDEERHFFSLPKLADELKTDIADLTSPIDLCLNEQTLRIGCLLCEDAWSDDYTFTPLALINKNHDVDLFINISNSPYTLGKNNKRNRVFSSHAKSNNAPFIYVNNIGIQNNGKTIYTFDGSSTVYDANGKIIAMNEPYTNQLNIVGIPLEGEPSLPAIKVNEDTDIANIYTALRYGIKNFLQDIHMEKVVIGISGGIDSAVAAALYASILPPENVLLVNMPSIYNSNTTKDLAQDLAKNLKCLYTIMPIQDSVDTTVNQIKTTPIQNLSNNTTFYLDVSSFVTENIQARDRSARVLAGIAASFGGGFTCNANKSETTVGYSTLYGDQSGFLAALADLWKFQIYDLAYYLNQVIYKREVIPQETIDIVPSAELSSNQCVDEGKGDPIKYPYHDYLFRAFCEHWNRATPEDILTWYKEDLLEEKLSCEKGLIQKYFSTNKEFIDDLERWWNLYSGIAVAKRIQAPPILAISRRAYGFDHREAQNGAYYTAQYRALKKELLK